MARLAAIDAIEPALEAEKPARSVELHDPEAIRGLQMLGLISTKPILYVANVNEDDVNGQSANAQRVREWRGPAPCARSPYLRRALAAA